MNRLTARDKHGHAYYPKCFESPCEGERNCCTYVAPECTFDGKVLDRLAAYEDTGLEPEQIHDWIPVSEGLPDEPFACDVTVLDSNQTTLDEFENVLPYHVGYDGEDWNDAEGNTIPFEVTAWKPAPEPYREG